jgi:hypothetical protein
LLERLLAFALRLEQGADADVCSAYLTEIDAGVERDLLSVGACVAEAKRRGLGTANWPCMILSVPVGDGDHSAADAVVD